MKKILLLLPVLCAPLFLFSQKKQLLVCDTFNNRVVNKFESGDAIAYLLESDSIKPYKKGYYDKEFSTKIRFRKGKITAITDSTVAIDNMVYEYDDIVKIVSIKKGLKIGGIALTSIGALLLTASYLELKKYTGNDDSYPANFLPLFGAGAPVLLGGAAMWIASGTKIRNIGRDYFLSTVKRSKTKPSTSE